MSSSYAGLFPIAMDQAMSMTDEIPVQDSVDRLLQRRIREAHELINEGNILIRKGQKKKNNSLLTKGRIKKEIGEKQLQFLKGQSEDKKSQDKLDDW